MLRHYYGDIADRVTKADINRFLLRIERWIRTKGPLEAAKRVKLARLATTRFLTNEPLVPPIGIALTRDFLPKVLPPSVRSLVRANDPRGISLALTFLSVSRGLLGGLPVDTEAIESPSKGGQGVKALVPLIPEFLRAHRIYPFVTDWREFHWSTKTGPTGPALVSALGDWRLLPDPLKQALCVIGGEAFSDLADTYASWSSDLWAGLLKVFPHSGVNRIRKLSVKPDREGKSRVFAILDYYTQSVLRPIHLGLFTVLRKFPSDCTFAQSEGLNLDPASGAYHSLDLSSATDRFPLELQKELLAQLIGVAKADAWAY